MFSNFRSQILQLSPAQITLLTLWTLTMISIPIVDWSNGWTAMVKPISAGATISSLVVVGLLMLDWGWREALRVSAMIFALSWLAEVVGSRWGIPFGDYGYTDLLRPQILGVPVQIPLGWLMMLPPSWAATQTITHWIAPRYRFIVFASISALSMTAWDFFLDPMMVTWGIWVWHKPSGFFEIPWLNYIGWFCVSFLITWIVRPKQLLVAPLLLIYTAIWLLNSAGLGIFWDLIGPAVVGFVVMGLLVFLAWTALGPEK